MSKINLHSLQQASTGKTACNGGLNKDDIILYLNSIKYPVPDKCSREELNDILKSALSSSSKTIINPQIPSQIVKPQLPPPMLKPQIQPHLPIPPQNPQHIYHPSGVINPSILPSTKDLPFIGTKKDKLLEINNNINGFVTKLNSLSLDFKRKGLDIATEICKVLLNKNADGSTPLMLINKMINEYVEISLNDPTLASNKFISDRRRTLASLLGSFNNITKNKCIPQGGTGAKELFADIEASIIEYKLMNIEIGTSALSSKKDIAVPTVASKKAIALESK